MAVQVVTSQPEMLLEDIKHLIDLGKIDTWLYDEDGDFTHDADQWRFNAWIRPLLQEDRVVFGIICRNDRNLSVVDYAIYHGRFVEMLLTHFDKLCQGIEVSPLATNYDHVVANKK